MALLEITGAVVAVPYEGHGEGSAGVDGEAEGAEGESLFLRLQNPRLGPVTSSLGMEAITSARWRRVFRHLLICLVILRIMYTILIHRMIRKAALTLRK